MSTNYMESKDPPEELKALISEAYARFLKILKKYRGWFKSGKEDPKDEAVSDRFFNEIMKAIAPLYRRSPDMALVMAVRSTIKWCIENEHEERQEQDKQTVQSQADQLKAALEALNPGMNIKFMGSLVIDPKEGTVEIKPPQQPPEEDMGGDNRSDDESQSFSA